ncbi:MAG: hypothetical protein IJW00_07555 [Clostridia bacterium]|nr:hypothetical protein [Clostridia bacterium]
MKKITILIIAFIILAIFFSSCNTPQVPSVEATTKTQTDISTSVIVAETKLQTIFPEEPENLYSNDRYSLTLLKNKCYINFADGNQASPEEGAMLLGSIDFSSLPEMKHSFLQNTLTDQQVQILRTAFASYSYGNENGIEICNLTSLYQAVYPQEIQASKVTLVGENYYFSAFDSADFSNAITHVATQTKYEQYYTSEFSVAETSPYVTITNQTDGLFDGLNCKIIEYEYPNSGAKCRDHIFDIDNNGISYHVNVRYRLKSPSSVNWRESETLPSDVWMFWQQDGQYFFIEIDDLNIEPTVEWLSSFGVTPYIDNSDHMTS